MSALGPGRPIEHPIHAALIRTPLLAGAEPGFVILEICTILALLTVVGLHLATLALSIFWATVVHSLFVRLAAKDPLTSALYLRSLRAPDWAAATSRLSAPPRSVRPAIPES